MPNQQAPLRRVLIVDDDEVVADTLVLILRGRGIDARAVYSGEDAAVQALSWNADVVISDVMMGKMNGVALAIYLAQALPSCRVLLMSGAAATAELLKESIAQGHDFPILAKPFHPDRLFELLAPSVTAGSASHREGGSQSSGKVNKREDA